MQIPSSAINPNSELHPKFVALVCFTFMPALNIWEISVRSKNFQTKLKKSKDMIDTETQPFKFLSFPLTCRLLVAVLRVNPRTVLL